MQIWLKPPYQPEFQTTLEDINAKVSSGEINPTESYFWREGMTEWEPVTNLVGNKPISMPPPPVPVEIIPTVTPKNTSSEAINSPIGKEELEELFVHKNYKYYKRQFISPSFNWAAFFFPLQWSAYRKLDNAAYAYIGISMLYVVCESLFGSSSGIIIPLIFWLIPAFIYGSFGNFYYKRICDKCVSDAISGEKDVDYIKYSVVNNGGVSFIKVIGFSVFIAFMMVIMGGIKHKSPKVSEKPANISADNTDNADNADKVMPTQKTDVNKPDDIKNKSSDLKGILNNIIDQSNPLPLEKFKRYLLSSHAIRVNLIEQGSTLTATSHKSIISGTQLYVFQINGDQIFYLYQDEMLKWRGISESAYRNGWNGDLLEDHQDVQPTWTKLPEPVSNIKATTKILRDTIFLGESTQLRIEIDGADEAELPPNIYVDGLDINLMPESTKDYDDHKLVFVYSIRAKKPSGIYSYNIYPVAIVTPNGRASTEEVHLTVLPPYQPRQRPQHIWDTLHPR